MYENKAEWEAAEAASRIARDEAVAASKVKEIYLRDAGHDDFWERMLLEQARNKANDMYAEYANCWDEGVACGYAKDED